MNAAKQAGSWKDDAVRTIVKQGAWACLAFLVIAAVGYEIRWFVHATGAAVASYVQQSGENIKQLNAAVALLSANLDKATQQVLTNGQLLETQQQQLNANTNVLSGVQVTHDLQIKQQRDLLDLMNTANEMMAPVPQKHDEEISLLKALVEGLKPQSPTAVGP